MKDTSVGFCPLHHCTMRRLGEYFECPVDHCGERPVTVDLMAFKRPAVLPSAPTLCGRCGSICTRAARLSRFEFSILQCGQCGWKSGAMPSPRFLIRGAAPTPPADIYRTPIKHDVTIPGA